MKSLNLPESEKFIKEVKNFEQVVRELYKKSIVIYGENGSKKSTIIKAAAAQNVNNRCSK